MHTENIMPPEDYTLFPLFFDPETAHFLII